MEPATLRRMTLVLRVGVPNETGRERIWRRVLDGEGLSLGDDAATRLAARWEASAGLAAGAARAARLAGGAEHALQTTWLVTLPVRCFRNCRTAFAALSRWPAWGQVIAKTGIGLVVDVGRR